MADHLVKMPNLLTMIEARKQYGFPKSDNKTLEMVQEPEKASGTGDIDWDVEMDFSDGLQARNPYGLPKSNNKLKIVVRVTMNGQKSRFKALKTAVGVSGVESAALAGEEKNQIEVVGDHIDAVELTMLLSKKVGYADLICVKVISLSTDGKRDSRRQFIHISQLSRSSPFRGSNSEGISTSSIGSEDLQRLLGTKRENAANSLGVSVSTFKRICRRHGIERWPYPKRNNVWKPLDPQGEKNASPTCKTLSANRQTALENEGVGQHQVPNEFLPDSIGGPNSWNSENDLLEDVIRTPTLHDSCPDNYPDMGSSIPPMFKESGEARGSYEWAFQLEDQSTVSTSYLNPNTLVFPQHQKASTQMVSENMGISEDWRQHQIASTQMVSENMEILEDWRNLLVLPAEAFMEGIVSGSSNWTLPTCSNPALSQTTTTIPHMMPYLPASQDLRSVTLKATYWGRNIRFELPLTSGIAELKEAVSLGFELELGSFVVEYKDEDGDWILIGRDKDLRDCLQLFSSSGNQVIRLLVTDKVPNATNFC